MQLSYTLHSACASRRLFKCFLVIIGGGCPLDVLHRIPVFGRPDQLHAGLASDLHISYSMKITSGGNSPMHPELRRAYDTEMMTAARLYNAGDLQLAFSHLEHAHILGQSFSIAHARTHWWMLKVGVRNRDIVEITGQIPRILGALFFSRIWVPIGNTGGARVPPFKPMPIPHELQVLLDQYRHKANQ